MDKDLTRPFLSHNRERGPMWVISLSTCPTRKKKTPCGRAYGRPAVRLALRAFLTYPDEPYKSSFMISFSNVKKNTQCQVFAEKSENFTKIRKTGKSHISWQFLLEKVKFLTLTIISFSQQ